MPFVPSDERANDVLHVPFFEDSSKENIPGRGTEKSVKELQREAVNLLIKLGAGNVQFLQGYWDETGRYGYQINFSVNRHPGRMEICALPLESETQHKRDRALAQALYFLRDWLSVEERTRLFRPGAFALLPFMVTETGETVSERFVVQVGGMQEFTGLFLPPPK